MAKKEEKAGKKLGASVKKAAKILFGILIILVGGFVVWWFLPEFLEVLKGVIGMIIIIVGLVVVALGWTD
jgi:hypothetical protein